MRFFITDFILHVKESRANLAALLLSFAAAVCSAYLRLNYATSAFLFISAFSLVFWAVVFIHNHSQYYGSFGLSLASVLFWFTFLSSSLLAVMGFLASYFLSINYANSLFNIVYLFSYCYLSYAMAALFVVASVLTKKNRVLKIKFALSVIAVCIMAGFNIAANVYSLEPLVVYCIFVLMRYVAKYFNLIFYYV